MSDTKKIFAQFGNYFTGHIAVILAGFISFPIFTRIFSVREYGIMSLVTITLVFATTISKFGVNKGAVRFYEEFKSQNEGHDKDVFYSTLFFGGVLVAIVVSLLYLLCLKLASYFISDSVFTSLLCFTIILISFRSLSAIFLSFLNAEQNSKKYVFITIFQKYSTIALSVFFVCHLITGLVGYYLGIIVSELLTLLILTRIFEKKISSKKVNVELFEKVIRYGLPLIVFEFSGIILTYGDRYLLQFFHGARSVGMYSVGYNLSTYCSNLLISPFILCVFPAYMKIWAREGRNATEIFLNRALNVFLLVSIAIIFGVSALSKELVTVLASGKYLIAYAIIPYVITGLFINGSNSILSAGLYIDKKTALISGLTLFAGMLNVVLNIFLIPKFGIIGASAATLISYFILTALRMYFSLKGLRIQFNYKSIMKYLASGVIMFIAIKLVHTNNVVASLFLKIFLGAMVYFGLIITIDQKFRRVIHGGLVGKIKMRWVLRSNFFQKKES